MLRFDAGRAHTPHTPRNGTDGHTSADVRADGVEVVGMVAAGRQPADVSDR
jgi:hypothetical protein